MAFVELVASSSVVPSGSARATASAPILPAAPPRLSTTTVWPSRSASALATSRAVTSVAAARREGVRRCGWACRASSAVVPGLGPARIGRPCQPASGEAPQGPSQRIDASMTYLPQRSARGLASRASSNSPSLVAGCSASRGCRTASLRMTPPAAITTLVARRPHWRFS